MRLSTVCTFAFIALGCLVPADRADSQALTTGPSATTAAATQTDGARMNRVQAKLARAQAVAARVADQAAALGYADNAWRYELINHLMKADDASFAGVEATSDLASALRNASTAAASAAGAQPKSLGDIGDDLVYTPITPCRIVDTRNAGAGGAFAAAETRTYTYAGSAAQGGTACVPATVVPEGLAVNVTIVSQGLGSGSNSGFLSVFPQGGNALAASWMNYTGDEILANAGVASINQSNGQFSVFAQNPTQVVVDVFGVLRPPQSGGTLNYLTKWTPNGNTLGTSSIYDSGTNVGIGTASPTHNLDIHGVNTAINLAESGGATATISRYSNRLEIQPSDIFQVAIGAVANPSFIIVHNGDVGLGNNSPVNKLQIGSVGSSGYSGNDIAFGNGVQVSGIAQLAGVAQWYSNTNIALMPLGTGQGRVGINTTSPIAPLEVDGFVLNNGTDAGFFRIFDLGGVDSSGNCSPNCPAGVSIYADHNVMALEFDADSDVRIKNLTGTSDSTKDLDTLNAIEVTDYTLKDKLINGDKPFKKVIAQQVEAVYPQVVSRHTDFIPNVYRSADAIEKTGNGYALRFNAAHGISAAAKRIKLLVEGDGAMQKANVLGIPSDREVLVDAQNLDGHKIFVYGEEVDDFRTVDYEGLTTLNISATQELSKRLAQKDREIAALRAELDAQKIALADLAELKAQFAAYKRDAQPTLLQAAQAER
jgi:hypothetical protein